MGMATGRRTVPIHYHLDAKRRRVICEAEGRLTGADMKDFDRRFRNDPGITPNLDQLIDITKADISGITAHDVREMVALAPVLGPSSFRAFVARGSLAYGLMRMFTLYREGRSGTVEFFENRASAELWLDQSRQWGDAARSDPPEQE